VRIVENFRAVIRRLRAALLLVAMLLASLAPTAAVSLHGDDGDGMSCCRSTDECGRPAMQRACCPCAPQVPSSGPASAAHLAAPTTPVAAPAWVTSEPAMPGALAPSATQAFALRLHEATHDPPWLLHASLLMCFAADSLTHPA
jgi:hypothetical protein